MTIHIEQLSFKAIIGLLEFERHTPQRIIIDLQAHYNYDANDNFFIDYAQLAELIKEIMVKGEFELIESALIALESQIIQKYSKIRELEIKITKPDILNNCQVAVSKKWVYNNTTIGSR